MSVNHDVTIALYTIFRCTNYGAVLQAYALARVLRGMVGEETVEVVNHRMDARDTHLLGKITNPNTPWFQRWRNRRKFAARYFRPDEFELRRVRTVRFIEEDIRPTAHLYRSPDELRTLPAYDTVVVGSDQIWNPVLNHDFGCNQYLAEYLPEDQRRVAYAASFGVARLPPACKDRYARALGRFAAITCREESGAAICKLLLGERPDVVLDPTLLMSANEWHEVVGNGDLVRPAHDAVTVDPPPGVGHVAAYWVRAVTQEDVDRLVAIAANRNCEVRLMSAGPLAKLDFPSCVIPEVAASPLDFVRSLSSSSAVVTDSFHGLQFATLFHKPFIALGDLTDPESNAARLVDFCARYGLSGGVYDLSRFRAGEVPTFAAFDSFDELTLVRDREFSLKRLQEMIA